jgi:hypothetical protein
MLESYKPSAIRARASESCGPDASAFNKKPLRKREAIPSIAMSFAISLLDVPSVIAERYALKQEQKLREKQRKTEPTINFAILEERSRFEYPEASRPRITYESVVRSVIFARRHPVHADWINVSPIERETHITPPKPEWLLVTERNSGKATAVFTADMSRNFVK